MVAVLEMRHMYKILILISLVAVAFVMTSCHPKETASPVETVSDSIDNKDTSEAVDNTNAPSQDIQKKGDSMNTPAVDDNFKFFYREKRNQEVVDKYKHALQLIKAHDGLSGTLDNTSRRIGDWYVVGVDDNIREDPAMMPMDAPAVEHVHAYVIDMANDKVIAQNDFMALRPLFDALNLADRKPFDDIDDENKFLGSLAALVASVATGNWRYIEPISGQRFPDGVGAPRMKVEGDVVTFTYFVSGTGMMRSFTENTLTISPKEIVFNSQLVRMD